MPAIKSATRPQASAPKPRWDGDARELWWNGAVCKTFRHDAAHQRAVLDAFQGRRWRRRIDNPWLQGDASNRKKRLQQTVKNLNRGLGGQRIRFEMDGTGEGVRWREIT